MKGFVFLNDRIVHLIQIFSGVAIGQGAYFLAQTYMLWNQEFELVGQLGILLSLLTLGVGFADGGGTFLLQKKMANKDSRVSITSFIVARLLFTILCCLTLSLFFHIFDFGKYIPKITPWIYIVMLISSLNLNGYLDLIKKTKITGPCSGLNWLLASIVIFNYKSFNDSLVFSVSFFFCCGLIISVLLQWKEANLIQLLRSSSLNYIEVKKDIGDVSKYNFIYFVNQIYGRLLPIIVLNTFGAAISGMYVYGKSVVGIINQLVVLSRRTEFAALLTKKAHGTTGWEIISTQKITNFIVTSAAFFGVLLFLLAHSYGHESYIFTMQNIAILLSINILWAISSSLSQYHLINDGMSLIVSVTIVGVSLSITAIWLTEPLLGLVAIYSCEALLYVFNFGLFYARINRSLT